MLTRPSDVVDLWHNDDDLPHSMVRRQSVREEWPELGRMLDRLPPADVRSLTDPEPEPEGTIIDVPWYAVVVVGMILFVAGMVVQKFVVGS